MFARRTVKLHDALKARRAETSLHLHFPTSPGLSPTPNHYRVISKLSN